jgi:hypothetical protein
MAPMAIVFVHKNIGSGETDGVGTCGGGGWECKSCRVEGVDCLGTSAHRGIQQKVRTSNRKLTRGNNNRKWIESFHRVEGG